MARDTKLQNAVKYTPFSPSILHRSPPLLHTAPPLTTVNVSFIPREGSKLEMSSEGSIIHWRNPLIRFTSAPETEIAIWNGAVMRPKEDIV